MRWHSHALSKTNIANLYGAANVLYMQRKFASHLTLIKGADMPMTA